MAERLSDKIVEALLPTAPPPEILPRGASLSSVQELLGSLNELQSRVFRWQSALQAFAESQRFNPDYPGFQFFTFGFIPLGDPPSDLVKHIGGYTFGIALELEASKVHPPQEIVLVEFNGRNFPLVINRRHSILHVPNPTNPPGTGACWGRSHKKAIKPASEGVLTAEHVVSGLPLGSSVSMSGSGLWHLGDRGSCKLDAALIVQAGSIPTNVTPLRVQMNPVANTPVSFQGSVSGQVTAKITHSMVHPTYLNDDNPMRVFFDSHGQGGDSGALVQETNSGLGVGIYMGVAPVPATTGEGISQALSQAQDFLRLDLFI